MIADLHCHPVLNPYNTEGDIWEQHEPTDAERSAMINTANINSPISAKFTQADFTSAAGGTVRLIFVALYPIEQGFVTNLLGGDILDKHKSIFTRLLNAPLKFFVREVLDTLTAGHLEQVAAKVVMNMKGKRYRELSSEDRNYFDDLLGEYKYYLHQPQTHIINGKEYELKIVGSFQELSDALSLNQQLEPVTDKNIIAIIFSVEGAHSLGAGQLNQIPNDDDAEFNMLNDMNDPATKEMFESIVKNIGTIKSLGGGRHCPFFITFSHHFWNQLCGHAMSLAKIMHTLFDQQHGLATGFTELGKSVLTELLSDQNGRRILIDVKHMSVKGRKWYYHFIEENYWQKGIRLPIIASHMGVTGLYHTTENISTYPADMDDHYNNSGWFNTWDINLSDEEILLIHQSRGLIGLNMDQRILSGASLVKSVTGISRSIENKGTSLLYKSIWAEPVLANILHIVRVVQYHHPGDPYAWQMIMIGSDLDGMIDALDAYCHSMDFPILRLVLKEKMTLRSAVEPLLQNINIDEMLDNFFYKNALRFLQTNFK